MSQHAIELGDVLASIPGIWSLFGDFKKAKESGDSRAFGEFMKEQIPNILGIGKVDESLYAKIIIKLSAEERKKLSILYSKMHNYEVDSLRLVVTGIQSRVEKVIKTTGTKRKGDDSKQPTKEEIIYESEDPRVKFFQDLAKEVNLDGTNAEEVVKDLRTHRLIIEDPYSQRMLRKWYLLVGWIEKNILEFFGVDELSKIDEKMICEKITKLGSKIPVQEGSFSLNPFNGIRATLKKFFT